MLSFFPPMVLVIQQYPEDFFTKCQHLYFLKSSKIPAEAHITDVMNRIWLPTEGK